MPVHPYVSASALEKRACEKFNFLLSELTGARISHEQAFKTHLINMSESPLKDGYVQVKPQALRFAVDELSLVLKEIKRVYGK